MKANISQKKEYQKGLEIFLSNHSIELALQKFEDDIFEKEIQGYCFTYGNDTLTVEKVHDVYCFDIVPNEWGCYSTKLVDII